MHDASQPASPGMLLKAAECFPGDGGGVKALIEEGRQLRAAAADEAFSTLSLHEPWPARAAWAKWLYDNGGVLFAALSRVSTPGRSIQSSVGLRPEGLSPSPSDGPVAATDREVLR